MEDILDQTKPDEVISAIPSAPGELRGRVVWHNTPEKKQNPEVEESGMGIRFIYDDPRERGSFEIPEVDKPSWSHPAIAGGKLYLREQDRLYCYDVRAPKAG